MEQLPLIGEWWMWIGFIAFIFSMLAIDLIFLGGGEPHKVTYKEALKTSAVWIALALLFNLLLWVYLQQHYTQHLADEKALEFLTGYVIEKLLSLDNVFAFVMVFHYFKIPLMYQKRVLTYGVLSAVFLRLAMILLGVAVISEFHWILGVLGIFLIYSGVKTLLPGDEDPHMEKNPVYLFLRNHIRVTHESHKEHFFILKNGHHYATPMFLALILVEISDIIFAVDSVPAIFAITQDPFIVFTSNIFAILGLRALCFLLINALDHFYYLKHGVGLILIFIGLKMVGEPWYTVSTLTSLCIVLTTLVLGIAVSMLKNHREKKHNHKTKH